MQFPLLFFLTGHHFAPYTMAGFIAVLYTLSFNFVGMFLSHITPVVSIHFDQAIFTLLYTSFSAPQLHIFRIICIDYSDLFTLCLNHYAYADLLLLLAKEHSMSLRLPVALYCSMHFRRHGSGSRSGLWLSDGWYVRLPCECLRACADGVWTVCECAICACGSIRLYLLHMLHIILHLLRLFYLSLLL